MRSGAKATRNNRAGRTGSRNNADLAESEDPYDLDAVLPDYVAADVRLKIDESDREMRQMFVADATLIPGFISESVNNRLKRTGQSANDLCTCSARKMTAKARQLEKEIENSPNSSVIYASTLGGAIDTCLT